MNSKVLIGLIGVIVIGGIAYTLVIPASPPAMVEEGNNSSAVDSNKNVSNTQSATDTRYVEYSLTAFESAKDKKRVLFFHAKWCPTCKAADQEFNDNLSQIPESVLIFKTDYDTEIELKKKYGITYQHTFVQVDDEDNEVNKWNGGGVKELMERVI